MKNYFLALLAIFSLQTGFAQTEAGNKFIEGSFKILSDRYSTDNQGSHRLSFDVSSKIGYFIRDNFAVGVALNGVVSTLDREDIRSSGTVDIEQNKFNYGVGLFARYYMNVSDKLKFYINGGANYKKENLTRQYTIKTEVTEHINNKEMFDVGLAPGLVYFATPKLGIQATFGSLLYSYSKSDTGDGLNDISNQGLELSMSSLNLGLSYYF